MKLDNASLIKIASNFSVSTEKVESHSQLQEKIQNWSELKKNNFGVFKGQCASLIQGKDQDGTEVAAITISSAEDVESPKDSLTTVESEECFVAAVVIPHIDANRFFISVIANMVMN